MNPVVRQTVTPLLLLLCVLAWSYGDRASVEAAQELPKAEPPTEPVAVSLVKVEVRSMPRYLRTTGELKAAQDSDVAADATGKVLTAPIERGSEVTEGDTLVTLDDRSTKFSLAEAEATVESAKAQLALSKTEVIRNEPLVKAKATSQTEFLRLEANRDAAQASLAAAEARRDLAKRNLSNMVISAPFSGIIAERVVDPGEYVRVGSEVARLVSLDWLRLQLTIPEAAAGHVHEGQIVTFVVAAWSQKTFTGEVKYIGAAVRENTRDLLIEARVDNADRKLKPGMFAEGKIALSEAKVTAVPDTAVRISGKRRSIFLIDGGHASEVLVELGESNKGWVEIINSLKPADAVIDSPPKTLRDGDLVKPDGKN
jgi:RND family efflux transporter MFP subunit